MYKDVSSCNTYNYGDSVYWDARYVQEAGPLDWYQCYSALRPLVRSYMSTSARVLMVGCGNAGTSAKCQQTIPQVHVPAVFVLVPAVRLLTEKLVEEQRTFNVVIALEIDMQMDVRDMSFFQDESFDSVIDKGTLDSLMCGTSAHLSATQMLGEVSRLLKPGGIDMFFLVTYGDPRVRFPFINQAAYGWKILLYIIPRPGFQKASGSSSCRSLIEPVPITDDGRLPADFVLEDPESHFIYFCRKMDETEPGCVSTY